MRRRLLSDLPPAPSLYQDGRRGLTLVDGETTVIDKAVIDALRELPAELGVRAFGGRRPKDSALN